MKTAAPEMSDATVRLLTSWTFIVPDFGVEYKLKGSSPRALFVCPQADERGA